MSRINWMNIAIWTGLLVSILLSSGISYAQWNRLDAVRVDRARVDQQIALQEKAREALEKGPRAPTGILTAPDNGREEVEFLSQLQRLMSLSGVKQIQLDRVALSPLPSINNAKPATGTTSTNASPRATGNKPAGPPQPSLLDLPLGVRAISSNLIVQGGFANIHYFIHTVQNYRYQVRAINMNSLRVEPTDDKGNLRATMRLTRFIRPPETTLSPILSDSSPGNAAPAPAGSVGSMGRPTVPNR